MGFPGGASGKDSTSQHRNYKETQVQSQGQEDSLEKGMATHSSILVWRIPWTERSLMCYSPGGNKELDTTEQLTLDRREYTISLLDLHRTLSLLVSWN